MKSSTYDSFSAAQRRGEAVEAFSMQDGNGQHNTDVLNSRTLLPGVNAVLKMGLSQWDQPLLMSVVQQMNKNVAFIFKSDLSHREEFYRLQRDAQVYFQVNEMQHAKKVDIVTMETIQALNAELKLGNIDTTLVEVEYVPVASVSRMYDSVQMLLALELDEQEKDHLSSLFCPALAFGLGVHGLSCADLTAQVDYETEPSNNTLPELHSRLSQQHRIALSRILTVLVDWDEATVATVVFLCISEPNIVLQTSLLEALATQEHLEIMQPVAAAALLGLVRKDTVLYASVYKEHVWPAIKKSVLMNLPKIDPVRFLSVAEITQLFQTNTLPEEYIAFVNVVAGQFLQLITSCDTHDLQQVALLVHALIRLDSVVALGDSQLRGSPGAQVFLCVHKDRVYVPVNDKTAWKMLSFSVNDCKIVVRPRQSIHFHCQGIVTVLAQDLSELDSLDDILVTKQGIEVAFESTMEQKEEALPMVFISLLDLLGYSKEGAGFKAIVAKYTAKQVSSLLLYPRNIRLPGDKITWPAASRAWKLTGGDIDTERKVSVSKALLVPETKPMIQDDYFEAVVAPAGVDSKQVQEEVIQAFSQPNVPANIPSKASSTPMLSLHTHSLEGQSIQGDQQPVEQNFQPVTRKLQQITDEYKSPVMKSPIPVPPQHHQPTDTSPQRSRPPQSATPTTGLQNLVLDNLVDTPHVNVADEYDYTALQSSSSNTTVIDALTTKDKEQPGLEALQDLMKDDSEASTEEDVPASRRKLRVDRPESISLDNKSPTTKEKWTRAVIKKDEADTNSTNDANSRKKKETKTAKKSDENRAKKTKTTEQTSAEELDDLSSLKSDKAQKTKREAPIKRIKVSEEKPPKPVKEKVVKEKVVKEKVVKEKPVKEKPIDNTVAAVTTSTTKDQPGQRKIKKSLKSMVGTPEASIASPVKTKSPARVSFLRGSDDDESTEEEYHTGKKTLRKEIRKASVKSTPVKLVMHSPPQSTQRGLHLRDQQKGMPQRLVVEEDSSVYESILMKAASKQQNVSSRRSKGVRSVNHHKDDSFTSASPSKRQKLSKVVDSVETEHPVASKPTVETRKSTKRTRNFADNVLKSPSSGTESDIETDEYNPYEQSSVRSSAPIVAPATTTLLAKPRRHYHKQQQYPRPSSSPTTTKLIPDYLDKYDFDTTATRPAYNAATTTTTTLPPYGSTEEHLLLQALLQNRAANRHKRQRSSLEHIINASKEITSHLVDLNEALQINEEENFNANLRAAKEYTDGSAFTPILQNISKSHGAYIRSLKQQTEQQDELVQTQLKTTTSSSSTSSSSSITGKLSTSLEKLKRSLLENQ